MPARASYVENDGVWYLETVEAVPLHAKVTTVMQKWRFMLFFACFPRVFCLKIEKISREAFGLANL